MFYKKWLFVPAIEKFLIHSEMIPANVLIYDLEDSIRLEDKDSARCRLREKLMRPSAKEIFVRINSGEQGLRDLKMLDGLLYDGIVIPKMDGIASLTQYDRYLCGKKVIALVETIAGVKNIEEIASSNTIFGIAFGGEDFCRELGIETNDLAMQFARGQIVLNARYHHKYCIDTISLEYKNRQRFISHFHESMAMGFHSKFLIHPSQVEAILSLDNELDVDEMKSIVKQYEASKDGIVFINGRWYERPHIDRLKQLISEAEANQYEGC